MALESNPPTSLACPRCDGALSPAPLDGRGVVWVCPGCDGRAVGIGLLRRSVARHYVNRMWADAVERGAEGERGCPSCGRRMITTQPGRATLDVCRGCQLVWFDPNEFDDAPPLAPPARPPAIPPDIPEDALEEMARVEARAIAERYRRQYGEEVPLDEALRMVPGVLGLPLQEEPGALQRIPWSTWSICTVVLIAGAFALFNPELIERFGLVPSDAFRLSGATFVTSFFLHAGLFQLVTNLYFLAVFGDDVEDFLGNSTTALLIAVGALAGEGMHALFAGDRVSPLVGAAGGISAIVVFYGLKFPRAPLRYFRVFRWYTMPAGAAVLLWFLTKLLGGEQRLLGVDDGSPLVHLGGAAVGLLFWLLLRDQPGLSRPARNGS